MRVMMIGPSRGVKGGISAMVNSYYEAGLEKWVDLSYLTTMVDGMKIRKLLEAFAALLKFLVLIHQYDILHVHIGSLPSFYRKSIFIIYAKKIHKKVILHLHGGDFHKFYQPDTSIMLKRFIKAVFGCADKIIALSMSWKIFLCNIVEVSKIEVIPNGVAIPKCIKKEYSPQQMLFLGRVVREKGIFDLVQIMPEIVSVYSDVKLYIGGDGDIRLLKETIQRLNLQKHVVLIGWVTGRTKLEYLEKTSIFVLPSYNEGQPMSLLEAMSYKCSAVATNVGGIPEIIHHEINGFLVEPGDLKKMKEIILELLKTKERCAQIGEEAYKTIRDRYSYNHSVAALTKLYSEVYASPSGYDERRQKQNDFT